MDKPLVTIMYKLADGKRIRLEVTSEVAELLAQSDRQIRSQRRQDRRHLEKEEYIDGVIDTTSVYPQEDIADLVIRMDSYQQLHTAIEKLPAVHRRRVILYYFCDLKCREIARMENVHHSTVSRSLQQAVKVL